MDEPEGGEQVQPRVPDEIPGKYGGKLLPTNTSEKGRALAAKRWNTVERLARKALAQAAGVSTWEAGALEVLTSQATLANSGTRGSTPAANFVFKAGRLLREPETAAANSASDTDVAEIVALWRASKAANPELQQRARELLEQADAEQASE